MVYKPMTLGELATWLTGKSNSLRWRYFAEFLEEYKHESVDTRLALLAEEPLATDDHRWDVLLAALAEYLAAQDGRGEPVWAEERTLRQFWFPFNTRAARVDAIVHAPAAFRRRGVFLSEQELRVV